MSVLDFLSLQPPIQVMDVGASAINEVPVYQSLLERQLAHLNAFEGDPRQIAKIKEAYGDHATIYNDFLFDGTEQTLHIAYPESGMTSLLEPRQAALEFFNGFDRFGHVEGTEKVQTRKLDSIKELPGIDFLKMDIQGGELTVLKNGRKKLKNCLAVQLEVSFICLYENQPTFGEVDQWMRSQGYAPHCFLDIKRWSIFPTIFNNDFRLPGNQLMEADIVYIRDPLNLGVLSDEQLNKLAVIAHWCFSSTDLCVHILRELESRGVLDRDAHQRYLESLRKST